jgi:hypothetical protein
MSAGLRPIAIDRSAPRRRSAVHLNALPGDVRGRRQAQELCQTDYVLRLADAHHRSEREVAGQERRVARHRARQRRFDVPGIDGVDAPSPAHSMAR